MQLPTSKASYPGTIARVSTWGGTGYDAAYAIVYDNSGFFYTTGETSSFTSGGSHVFILKYNMTGALVWQRIWNGSTSNSEVGRGISLDSSGNVYVTGWSDSFGGTYTHVFLLKFNSTGNLLWQRLWTPGYSAMGYAVATDSQGNSYVTGYIASLDIFVLKYNSTGGLVWQRTFGYSSNVAYDIAVNSTGTGVYVTGFIAGAGDSAIIALDKAGNLLWQRAWSGEKGDALTTDADGNIYVAGTYYYALGARGVYIGKFDSTGNLLWQRTWSGVGSEYSHGITLDTNGTLYVTGSTTTEAFLLRLSTTGSLIAETSWGGTNRNEGFGVATDTAGDAFVTGYVSEGPSYSLGSVSDTLDIPTFSTSTPSIVSTATTHAAEISNGTVFAPSGATKYSGSRDAFLFEYCPACTSTPSSPVNLFANGTIEKVILTWQPPSLNGGSPIIGYNIYRTQTCRGQGMLIASIGNVTAYVDSSGSLGTRYCYEVTAINSLGEGQLSQQESATPQAPTPPSAPQNLTAESGRNHILLTWSPPVFNGGSRITGYNLYRGVTPYKLDILANLANITQFNDTEAKVRGMYYYYEVYAVNSIGEGTQSNEVSALASFPPTQPLILIAIPGSQSISLIWNTPTSNGGLPITNYAIYRGTNSGNEVLLIKIGNLTRYNDSSTHDNILYYYTISAINDAGESTHSNEATAEVTSPLPSWENTLLQNLSSIALIGSVIVLSATAWWLRRHGRSFSQAPRGLKTSSQLKTKSEVYLFSIEINRH